MKYSLFSRLIYLKSALIGISEICPVGGWVVYIFFSLGGGRLCTRLSLKPSW